MEDTAYHRVMPSSRRSGSTPAATQLTLSNQTPETCDAQVLVVLLAQGDAGAGAATVLSPGEDTLAEELADAVAALGLTGSADEVTAIPAPAVVAADVIVLSGVGAAQGELDPEAVRRATGAALRGAPVRERVAILAPDDAPATIGAVTEGALLGAYRFRRYKAAEAPQTLVVLTTKARTKAVKEACERATLVASGVNEVRDLVNTAPADLTPADVAEQARRELKGTKVKVEVLDLPALREGGYGGIVGVGQGSANEPRLVTLTWSPPRAKAHVALVGKGITFDSGGLSLKPPTGMVTMKSDMAGAATVLETIRVVAELGIPVKVTGFLALAENMPSGSAQRPGDVLTMRGGKTVEVLNTDAEGRLVMADALVDAAALEPDAIVDIATLTGAQLVALGPRVTGVMGTPAVRDAVVTASDAVGEQAWPMPLPEDLRSGLDSPIADLANIGDRFGGMLTAGLFLKEFVGDVPWAHLDIAGPSFNEGAPWGYTPKGGSGAALRTLVELVSSYAR